jgi:hypothetical protein
MANYNEDAVSKQIAKDPSIGPAEAKAIHGLLKGRGRGPANEDAASEDAPTCSECGDGYTDAYGESAVYDLCPDCYEEAVKQGEIQQI